jgi:leucyl/phenylalanyl-tRNA--protein transferase
MPNPVEMLLAAYCHGAFAMATSRRGRVDFYQADPRSVLPLDDGALTVPRSLRSQLRTTAVSFTADVAFEAVIRACADTPRHAGQRRPQTWINDWIISSYSALHRAGHAHSVEAWLPRITTTPTPTATATTTTTTPAPRTHDLVAGLYGVHIGGAFFGESMFSRPDLGGSNASKMCLVHLWHHLRARGFALLDTQIANDHMRQFGIVELRAHEFAPRLASAIALDRTWGTFTPAPRA